MAGQDEAGMAIIALSTTGTAPALAAYQQTEEQLAASRIRLTTGKRIIEAGDDSSSLAVASHLQTQGTTLRSALINGARASSLLQVAYGGLEQIKTILNGLSDLVATANTHGLTDRQRTTLDSLFQRQLAQIDTVVASTTYNGANLLDGTADATGAPIYQLGSPITSTLSTALPDMRASSLFPTPITLSNSAGALSATGQAADAQTSIDTALAAVAAYESRLASAEEAARKNLSSVERAADALIATDTGQEQNRHTSARLQQDRAAAVFAQALGLNNDLLKLIY